MKKHLLNIENQLCCQEAYLTELIEELSSAINQFPHGSLHIKMRTDGPNYFWYKNGKNTKEKEIYIPRNNKELINALAQKKYFMQSKKEAEKLLKTVKTFNTAYDASVLTNIYYNLSEQRRSLISPLFLSDYDYEKMWRSVEYQGKGNFPENWEIKSLRGECMRSKSEVVIASMLDKYNVPYRYEYPLTLDNRVQYPDFIVLNKRTRQEYLWEHLGKMGEEEYASTTVLKIDTYAKYGYFQGINLIFTMETKERRTNMDTYEKYIKKYLL